MARKFLTVRECSEMLRITDARMKQILREGRIPGALNVGTAQKAVWRIPPNAIDRIDSVGKHSIEGNEFGL